jgi:hypothetical protein
LRVLVACEYSGRVRGAFARLGHEAHSCDLLPCEDDSPDGPTLGGHHWIEDAIKMVYKNGPWDLMIAHPPCTDLAVSGARWFPEKIADGRQGRALEFVKALMDAPIARIAIENPISIISSKIRKPDQIIQPWQFGHGEVKATCLWLKNLPALVPTKIVEGREARVWKLPPSPDRWKERSRTFEGVAEAMAEQWGKLV